MTLTTAINAPESRPLIFLWSIKDTDGSARRMLFAVIISDSRIFPSSGKAKFLLPLWRGHDVLYCWEEFTAGSCNIMQYRTFLSCGLYDFFIHFYHMMDMFMSCLSRKRTEELCITLTYLRWIEWELDEIFIFVKKDPWKMIWENE